jgi:hypothetical protein
VRDFSFKEPDEMIRDRTVFRTNSRRIREKLINEGKDLTLDKAIDIARTYEIPQSQTKLMEGGDEVVHSENGGQRARKKLQKPPTYGRCRRTHAE